MEIKILEGSVSHYKEANNTHVLAFGKIKEGSTARVKLKIEDVDTSSLSKTCGCTTSDSNESNVFTVSYNETRSIAPFAKVFVVNYIKGNTKGQGQIKITGNVIK